MKKIFTLLTCLSFLALNAQTWVQRLDVPSTTGYFNAIHFSDPTHGWAVGMFYGPPQSTLIYTTSDGGQSWSQINPISNFIAYDVFFITDQIGWMCGNDGKIFKTIDAGATWTALVSTVTGNIHGINFISETEGYFCEGGGVYKTTDGGINWTLSLSMFTARKVKFIDPQIVFAVGSQAIAKTIDGGANWTTTPLTSGYQCISFPDNTNGFIAGTSGKLSKTIDGGDNWTQSITSANGDINGIDFIDASIGWIATQSFIRKTIDGGVSWVTERTGSFQDIQALSATNAWAIAGGSIFQHMNCTNSTSNLTFAACDQFDFHGESYTSSGVFTQTIPNSVGCDSIVTLNITIVNSSSPAPAISGINGVSASPCVGNSFTFTAASGIPSWTYNWTIPSDWTITSADTLNIITGTYGAASGTASVIATNACNISSALFTSNITVNPINGVPATPTSIIPLSTPKCINSNLDVTVSPVATGATWNWSSSVWTDLNNGNATFNPYGGFALGSVGNGSVTVVVNNGCGSSAPYTQSFNFNLDAQPATPVISQVGSTLTTTESGAEYCWYEINSESEFCFTGTSGMTFTPTFAGDYYLVISSVNGCNSDASNTISTTTSITENEALNFNIYPNPANSTVSLSNVTAGSTVSIIDVMGKRVFSTKAVNTTVDLSVEVLSNGIYFIEIENNGAVAQKKLVVSK
jgi:photosystem II stability/assembly factor-like uncharacterized protein